MKFGGALLSSKIEILSKLPNDLIPTTIEIRDGESFASINTKRMHQKMSFPVIAKPDNAERGKGIYKLENENELKELVDRVKQQTYLIQEYVSYPIELGVLVFRNKKGELTISSMCEKSFCSVTGDGETKLGDLIQNQVRVAHRIPYFKNKYQNEWNDVLDEGQTLVIEPIGSHNLGTKFCDARKRINEDIYKWLDRLLSCLPLFDYGRIDMKIESWDAFKFNRGIKILEINGVNAEPIHIYDSEQSIGQAYQSIFYHMKVIFNLSQQKESKPPYSFYEFLKGAYLNVTQKNIC